MTNTFNIDNLFEEVERFNCLQMEYKEQTLAEIITKYDFIVGSIECKDRLKGILPKGANIICSPYIESPTMIYAIKKFDVKDILLEPQYDTDRIEDAVEMAVKTLKEKPKTGQWIKTDKRIKDNLYVWKVTCCGREFIADADLKSRDNYCLNCGAKIESEDICSTTQLTI